MVWQGAETCVRPTKGMPIRHYQCHAGPLLDVKCAHKHAGSRLDGLRERLRASLQVVTLKGKMPAFQLPAAFAYPDQFVADESVTIPSMIAIGIRSLTGTNTIGRAEIGSPNFRPPRSPFFRRVGGIVVCRMSKEARRETC